MSRNGDHPGPSRHPSRFLLAFAPCGPILCGPFRSRAERDRQFAAFRAHHPGRGALMVNVAPSGNIRLYALTREHARELTENYPT